MFIIYWFLMLISLWLISSAVWVFFGSMAMTTGIRGLPAWMKPSTAALLPTLTGEHLPSMIHRSAGMFLWLMSLLWLATGLNVTNRGLYLVTALSFGAISSLTFAEIFVFHSFSLNEASVPAGYCLITTVWMLLRKPEYFQPSSLLRPGALTTRRWQANAVRRQSKLS